MANISRRPPWRVVPRIGQMRESLALQSNVEVTSTGTGYRSNGWTTYATVAAEFVEPAGGTERVQAGTVVAELVALFRLRARSDVVAGHRALWRGQTFAVLAVIPVMDVGPRFVELQCSLAQ